MEGLGTDDMNSGKNDLDSEEVKEVTFEDTEEWIKEIPEHKTEKRRVGKLPIITIFVIGLIIGIIISPYILDMFNEETPVYHQYTTIKGTDTIVYKNEKLKVQITKNIEYYYPYQAEWTDIHNRQGSTSTWRTTDELMDDVLGYAEYLTVNQLKWYQYMLKYKL